MTDGVFLAENGIVSPFKYTIKLGQDFTQDSNDENVVNLLLEGSFEVKKGGGPPTQAYESDMVLRIEKSVTGLCNVTGSGENRYGFFKLFGTYDCETGNLRCFREYLRSIKPQKKKPKRKAAKRPTLTLTQPAKRERKVSAHLKEPKPAMKYKSKDDMKALKDMINKLISDDREKFFSQPVDPVALSLPDYTQVITCPMDLGTVLRKLEEGSYADMDEGVKDVRLTFQNAMLYNPKKHPVHTIAKMHLNHFERDLKNFMRNKEKQAKQQMKKRQLKKPGKRKVMNMSKLLEEQQRKFQKSKKKILDMFSSSSEEDNSSDEEEVSVKPQKKKKKKSKSGEMEYMKNMMSMMSNQLEMMQQWQNTSLQEINRLNQELSGTKQQNKATLQAISANYSSPHIPPQAGMMPTYGNPAMMLNTAHTHAQPQPKVGRPKKVRPLTIAQMKQLSEDIHKLSADDVMGLLEVVSGHGELVAGGEEMELDIENMKPEVARACYKYVSKKISKAKNDADIKDLQFDDS